MKGIFITFEGPDGSGKSTQIKLLKDYLENKGCPVMLTREPGGTPISEAIRELLLNPAHKEMSAVAEALLYAAARAQHVEERIRPALDRGETVLCDRFMDSSIAYQAYGRGLGEDVTLINRFAVQGTYPDITFFMDITPEEGRRRIAGNRIPDRLEQETQDFHRAVHEGYCRLREIYKDRYIVLDASLSIEEISRIVIERYEEYVLKRS